MGAERSRFRPLLLGLTFALLLVTALGLYIWQARDYSQVRKLAEQVESFQATRRRLPYALSETGATNPNFSYTYNPERTRYTVFCTVRRPGRPAGYPQFGSSGMLERPVR